MHSSIGRARASAWVAASVFASLLIACGGGSSPAEPHGPVDAVVSLPLTATDVARVTVTVTGPGIPAAGITAELVYNAATREWGGTVLTVPAGADRVVTARAYDAAGALVYEGASTGVAVTPGVTAPRRTIRAHEKNPTPFAGNRPARIDSIESPRNAVAGEAVPVKAQATDRDGDAITFAWTATAGTFASPAAPSTIWTAPAVAGRYDVTVSVTDRKGETDSHTVRIDVSGAPQLVGNQDVVIGFNNAPAVASVTVAPVRVDVNNPATVTAVASDPDGDAITYAWSTTDCTGTFASPSAATSTFTPTALPTSGSCTVRILVTDANLATNSGTATLLVGAPVVTDTPPPPPPPPATAPQCAGTFTSTKYGVAGNLFCLPIYAGQHTDLFRRAVIFTSLGGMNGGDALLPSFTFAAPPTVGTYTLADLSMFQSYVWFTGPVPDDLYSYVAAKNALLGRERGAVTLTVTSVTQDAAGNYEVHGSMTVTLDATPALITAVGPKWDDPLSKLPTDALGSTVTIQMTF